MQFTVISSGLECEPISSSKTQMKTLAQPQILTITQIYASTLSSTRREIASFFDGLEKAIADLSNRDYVIVMRYSNAQPGDDTIPNWKRVIGGTV